MGSVVVPGIMQIQRKRFRKMFLGGLGLNLLAVGLMVLTPGLKAIHLATCSHHNHGSVQCHDTRCTCHRFHQFNNKKGLLYTVSEQNHAGGVCPLCQALGAVGQYILSSDSTSLVASGAIEGGRATFEFVEHFPRFCFNHSISPRAPPEKV